MKTIYFFGGMLCLSLSLSFRSYAQCSLIEPAIELNSVSESGGNCTVSINLSFTIDKNNGNKFTYVHLWKPTSYPALEYKKAPEASELGSVLATLAIDTDGAVSLLSIYDSDPTNVFPVFTGLTIQEENLGSSLYRITINNIQFPVPGACADLPILKGDVWSSQASSSNQPIHCFSSGFNLKINDPTISGLINCNEPDGPRTYDLDILSTSPTAFEVSYKLYLDDGVLTDGQTTFGAGDNLIYTSPTTNLSSSQPISSKDEPYPYGFLEDKRTIWVELTSPSLPNAIIAELKNNCEVTLPVKLVKFKGDLLDNSVALSWVTTEERGSSYFDVERSSDLQEFSRLGRLKSKGSTNVTQHYNFMDQSPLKGNNYYRLKMVDADGSFEYSRIISVGNGKEDVAFELLGNPVAGSEIRFILKNERPDKVALYDLQGRQIAFKLSGAGNEFTLKMKDQIRSGIYVLSLKSGEKTAQTKKVLMP